MENKIIALDIGNVCLRITPERCAEALGYKPDVGIPENLLKSVEDLEHGKISEQQWLQDFQQITGNRFSDDELRSAYNLIIAEEIIGMKEFLRQKAEAGYRIIFFSDTSEIHLNCILRKLSFANLISGGIYSFEVGAHKPSPKMYEAFEKTFGKPDLYLDDKPDNIAAGKERGWNAYVFKSINVLKEL